MRHAIAPVSILLILALFLSGCSPKPAPNKGSKLGKNNSGPNNEPPPPPCHPGCFPAGTLVQTPSGLRAIEDIHPSETVLLIGSDGVATSGPVSSKFDTCNRLVEVETDAGNLLTTLTQPLCLVDGGFRTAGDLTSGDKIWRWENDERRAALVHAVSSTGREATVYNMVVGDSSVFVANGFLARGKPPLDAD